MRFGRTGAEKGFYLFLVKHLFLQESLG